MDYSKPTLIVISGPNGAGKSTHIQTMLPHPFEENLIRKIKFSVTNLKACL